MPFIRSLSQTVVSTLIAALPCAALAQSQAAPPATSQATSQASSQGALTLSDAISEAKSHSPQIDKSRSAVDEASWKKREAYSGFLPTVSASASYLLDKKYALTDIQFGGSPTPTSIEQIVPTSSMSLQAQLPLFDGFANVNRLEAGKEMEKAARNDHHWTEFSIERQVALQFYRAIAAQTLKGVAEQNQKTIEDHLRDVNLFRKAGVGTNFDVLRVEVQASEAQSEVLNTSDNAEVARNRLGELLGRESETRQLQGQLPKLDEKAIDGLTLEQISNRSDLQATAERVEALHEQDQAANRYWVPRLALFGQYQFYNNRTNGFDDWSAYRNAYQLGLSLNWNLFDGLVSISRAQQSGAQAYQSERSLYQARIHAKQDFDFWKRKYKYFNLVYKSRLSDVEKANESVRLAREGRRAGTRTNTDLLDAEAELFRARAGVVNAHLGAVEALVNLELVTGQAILSQN